MTRTKDRLFFFLGGRDLEMQAIRELLETHAPGRFLDKGLAWGARASDYRAEIDAALARGDTPVLVELAMDLDPSPPVVTIVDHHGPRSGADAPTSLEQVFRLLELPPAAWTRRLTLVAANDRGHVRAMAETGATVEEMKTIRAADRAAQGVTAAEDAAAESAVHRARVLAGGELTVVELPHNRTAPAADRLEPLLGGPGYRNLLVFCPDEADFFGEGLLIRALDEAFPGGWSGGELPVRGFWGRAGPTCGVLPFLLARLDTAIG